MCILNMRSRQFSKPYLSVGLYKIPNRTGLDLGSKISVKNTLWINAKIRFPIITVYEIEFLKTKQAKPPPLWYWLDLTRSYPSISSSLLKTVLSSLVSLNPVTVAFVSLAT